MNSVPLVLPFTLSASDLAFEGSPDAPSCANVLIDQSSTITDVSCLTPYWLRSGLASPSGQQFSSSDPLEGVALGCNDGTIYLLRQNFHGTYAPISIEKPLMSRSPSRTTAHLSRLSHSRPRTPNPSLAPFPLTSRARVVSAVSDEQAQAPKNYVDFDEEPEKLKDILKGVKDLSSTDRLRPSVDRSASTERQPIQSKGPASSSGPAPRGEGKLVLGAAHSPTPSITSLPSALHTPPSPFCPSYQLSLEFHVFPPRSVPGDAVTGLRALVNSRHLICLRSQGDLSVYSVNDGSCVSSLRIPQLSAGPPAGAKGVEPSESAWTWRDLFIHETGESTIILTSAVIDEGFSPDMSVDSEESSQRQLSRVSVFELQDNTDRGDDDLSLDKVAEWLVEGPSAGIDFRTGGDDAPMFSHMDPSNHLIVQRVVLVPTIIQSQSEPQGHSSVGTPLASFNPFKAPQELPENRGKSCRLALEDPLDIGELKLSQRLKGLRLFFTRDRIRGAAWSDSELHGFESDSQRIVINELRAAHEELKDITWFSWDTYCSIYSDRIQVSRLRLVDPNNDRLPDGRSSGILQSHVVSTVSIKAAQALHALSPTTVLSTGISSTGRRRVELFAMISSDNRKEWTPTTLWKSYDKAKKVSDDSDTRRITCLLPLELTHMILGYSDGTIGRSSFPNLVQYNSVQAPGDLSDIPLNGCVIGLHVVQNDRTGERLIVGGADDGSVAIWSLESMKTLARWILFIAPLQRVLYLKYDKGGPLGGCLLCVSSDGTIAVISLDNYSFLYMVPGAPAPLTRICVGETNLLLLYADDRARLWDVRTLEFRRSMDIEKAKDLLTQGGWAEMSLHDSPSIGNTTTTLSVSSPDSSSTILVDLGSFLSRAVSIFKSTAGDDHSARERTAEVLRSFLQVLLTPGLNPDIDAICRDRLGLPATQASIGFHRNQASTLIVSGNSQSPWCISGEVSASRALALIACLRTLMHFEDTVDHFNTVIPFYATSLSHTVGRGYVPPSLSSLAKWWFDVSSELRLAARTLFDAGVAGLTDEEKISLVDRWQHSLPFLLPDSERRSPVASRALLLCGFIAAGQHSLLSTSALNIISKSVMIYLHENDLSCKALAIDLCSRGFSVWQHYVDTMEMLRSLFNLATSTKKESISAQNVGPQARLAVLHIVTNNTGIFMTTLSLDILHPQSLEHRKSVMQLLAFLIRKKPLIVYSNLPKLLEAVVKSLDPNSTSHRDAVLDAATEILGHVVTTYPTIDFHMTSQRLAVGTGEGAIVMYDVKTATCLYVLECHRQGLAACSFSPDGHRLVSVSLEEGVVLVWKVGNNSFTSFFNPGAPPRQGHRGSDPFKTLNFNVGDAAVMTLEETFEHVRFEWTAERSVQLKIRDVTLTFST